MLRVSVSFFLFTVSTATTATTTATATSSHTYGVNLHNNIPTDASLQQMIHAGLQTFRIDGFSWRQLEPTQGIFNFSLYDAVIPRFQALGLKVITGCDHTLPNWIVPGTIHDPHIQSGIAKLYGALATHYNDVMWEFTNEPNANPTTWASNATGFTSYAIQVCDAIHNVVVSTSTCAGPSSAFISRKFKDFYWLQQTFEAGLLDHIDQLLVHPYRADAPETAIDDFNTLRNLVDLYTPTTRMKKIPIYNGEWGYASGSGSSPLITLEEQGILTARVFLLSHLFSEGLSIWYEWKDGGTNSSGELMGLVFDDFDPKNKSNPFTPKPSYYATKTLADVTKGTAFVGAIPTFQDGATTNDEYVFQFQNQSTGKTVLAAWSMAGFPHITRLPGGRGCYDTIDHLGNELLVVCEDPRGLHLNLTQAPIYLVSKNLTFKIKKIIFQM